MDPRTKRSTPGTEPGRPSPLEEKLRAALISAQPRPQANGHRTSSASNKRSRSPDPSRPAPGLSSSLKSLWEKTHSRPQLDDYPGQYPADVAGRYPGQSTLINGHTTQPGTPSLLEEELARMERQQMQGSFSAASAAKRRGVGRSRQSKQVVTPFDEFSLAGLPGKAQEFFSAVGYSRELTLEEAEVLMGVKPFPGNTSPEQERIKQGGWSNGHATATPQPQQGATGSAYGSSGDILTSNRGETQRLGSSGGGAQIETGRDSEEHSGEEGAEVLLEDGDDVMLQFQSFAASAGGAGALGAGDLNEEDFHKGLDNLDSAFNEFWDLLNGGPGTPAAPSVAPLPGNVEGEGGDWMQMLQDMAGNGPAPVAGEESSESQSWTSIEADEGPQGVPGDATQRASTGEVSSHPVHPALNTPAPTMAQATALTKPPNSNPVALQEHLAQGALHKLTSECDKRKAERRQAQLDALASVDSVVPGQESQQMAPSSSSVFRGPVGSVSSSSSGSGSGSDQQGSAFWDGIPTPGTPTTGSFPVAVPPDTAAAPNPGTVPAEEDPIQLLVAVAKAVVSGEQGTVHSLLSRLNQVASVYGNVSQRLSAYFLEGLLARLSGTAPKHNPDPQGLEPFLRPGDCNGVGAGDAPESREVNVEWGSTKGDPPGPEGSVNGVGANGTGLIYVPEVAAPTGQHTKRGCNMQLLESFQILVNSSPYLTFGQVAANSVILEALQGESRVHIIDFGIGHGLQWPALLQALAARPGGPPQVRLTGIETPTGGPRRPYCVYKAGARLSITAKMWGVPFEYFSLQSRLEDVTPQMLKLRKGEAIAVNCALRLSQLLDEGGPAPGDDPRSAVLRCIRALEPKICVTVEQVSNLNSPFFLSRFYEALYYYALLFESFDASLPRNTSARRVFEEHVLGRAIVNLVACEGQERVERQEPLNSWKQRMHRAGFRDHPVPDTVMDTVKALLATYKKVGHEVVREDEGSLLLTWKERPLLAMTAWQIA